MNDQRRQIKTPHKPGNTAASRKKRPTIQQVARQAGVSLGTVSAVLNDKGRISDATRHRVKETIEKLGYRPDLYASNLARRHTQLLGVIVSSLQNPFFAETAQAVENEAARHGFQISLMTTNFSVTQHRAVVEQLLGARIAGLAVLTSEDDAHSRALILASGVPAIFLDAGKPIGRCSVLRIDSRGGMSAAVKHLIALGHRDLLYIRNSQQVDGPPLFSHRLRDKGFSEAVRAFGVKDLRARILDIHGSAAEAGEQAIASAYQSDHYTAVIATTDMVAMGAYRGLQSRNLPIPQAVSVVGFDNIYFSQYMNPPLTTVDLSRNELSQLVVASLLQKSAGKLLRLQTRLIRRSSTAPPTTR